MSKSLPDFSSDSFTRYASARNGENLEVNLSSGYAVKYDLVGAIRRQYPDDEEFYTNVEKFKNIIKACLLYTSPSPRDRTRSRMPSSA